MTGYKFDIIDAPEDDSEADIARAGDLCGDLTDFLFDRAETGREAMQAICAATVVLLGHAPSRSHALSSLEVMYKTIYASIVTNDEIGVFDWSEKSH